MSNLIPAGMDRAELAAVLSDMAARIEAGDSYEGHLEYLIPQPDDVPPEWADRAPSPDAEFWVTGGYRVGNLQGQGGFRMIGRVP